MEQVTVKDKSFQLVIRVVRLYKHLVETKKKYVLSKQLLRSGTSIGANVSESQSGESKADFIHKLAIAQKETKETMKTPILILTLLIVYGSEFHSRYYVQD